MSDNQLCGISRYTGEGTYTAEGIIAIAEMLKVNVGAALAPAGVGSLESDATALQPCSVSAASGRSSSSLGDSRKRPRAQDDAGGSGEDVEEDLAAIIAGALAPTLKKAQQASA